QFPATHRETYRFDGRTADCGHESDKHLSVTVLDSPGSKVKAQEIELLHRIAAFSVIVLAVHDLRLLRVQFQFARRQPRFERIPQRERLLLAATVANGIFGVALKGSVGVLLRHPPIKRPMEN